MHLFRRRHAPVPLLGQVLHLHGEGGVRVEGGGLDRVAHDQVRRAVGPRAHAGQFFRGVGLGVEEAAVAGGLALGPAAEAAEFVFVFDRLFIFAVAVAVAVGFRVEFPPVAGCSFRLRLGPFAVEVHEGVFFFVRPPVGGGHVVAPLHAGVQPGLVLHFPLRAVQRRGVDGLAGLRVGLRPREPPVVVVVGDVGQGALLAAFVVGGEDVGFGFGGARAAGCDGGGAAAGGCGEEGG